MNKYIRLFIYLKRSHDDKDIANDLVVSAKIARFFFLLRFVLVFLLFIYLIPRAVIVVYVVCARRTIVNDIRKV